MTLVNRTTKPLPLCEPFANVAVYADCLAKIEQAGPVSHLIFAQQQSSLYDHCEQPSNIVVARVIIPTALLTKIARQLLNPTSTENAVGPADVVALN